MKIGTKATIFSFVFTLLIAVFAGAQSRHNAPGKDFEGTILAVTATRNDKKTEPIKIENLYLYENGI